MKIFKLILSLFVAAIFYSCAAPTVSCQAEKLGIVSYAAPKGWAKTPKENVVGFSEINQETGGFCIITLYGATDGTGNPARDFTREWKRLVFSNLKVEANPTTETQIDGEWTMTAGAAAAEMDGGGKDLAFLSVFSGDGKTVSVLGVFNEQSYLPKLEAFVGSVKIDNPVANNLPANNQSVALDGDGNLVIPEPTRQLTTVGTNVEQVSVAVQTNGRIVAACSSFTGNSAGCDFWVVCYNGNGSLDTTFGGSDLVVTPVGNGNSFDVPRSVAIQANGKIVGGGKSQNGTNNNFAAVHYNPNGSLDSRWGIGGVVTTDLGGSAESIYCRGDSIKRQNRGCR